MDDFKRISLGVGRVKSDLMCICVCDNELMLCKRVERGFQKTLQKSCSIDLEAKCHDLASKRISSKNRKKNILIVHKNMFLFVIRFPCI